MSSFNEFPYAASFLAGIVTFVSPCVLPLIPAYISFITGASLEDLKNEKGSLARIVLSSLFFIAGFSILFILLGASATYIGVLTGQKKDILRWAGGIIVIIFGLHISGILRLKFLYQEKRIEMKKPSFGYLGAFLLGIAFSAGWTPCVGPILSSILILASAQETVYEGMMLLAIYSAGLGLPFLLTALFINKALQVFEHVKKYYKIIEVVSGLILVLVGVLLLTDSLNMLTGYLTALWE